MTSYGNCPNHPEHLLLDCPICKTTITATGELSQDAVEVLRKVVERAYIADSVDVLLHKGIGVGMSKKPFKGIIHIES